MAANPKPERIVDPEYRAWIANHPCSGVNSKRHACWGPVDTCHVKSRGSGGGDEIGQLFPACRGLHQLQHVKGFNWFVKEWDLDLKLIAQELGRIWEDERARRPQD